MKPANRRGLALVALVAATVNAIHYLKFTALWLTTREFHHHVEFLGHEIAGLLWLWFFVWLQAEAPSARGNEKGAR